MTLLKKILFVSILFTSLISLSAKTAKYTSEDLILTVNYNDELVPGDAIFVRMSIQNLKNHKKQKTENEKNALLQLYQDKKKIDSSAFYTLPKTKKSSVTEMLTGIPLSSWLKNDVYSLKVLITFSPSDTREFTLPLQFKERTFFEEVIELNESNTAIKTDNSPLRTAQIEKLNNILFSIIPSDVYSLSKMQSPTTSERYTAYFGDRRKYVYVNGKSSTSLHYGNDYGVPTGTLVSACSAGKVVMAENRISTGWSIVVEHLPGLYSLYYHLSEMSVKEGDFVKAGDLLGKSGSTGLATGPHLHWEMRLNGAAVRPEFFLTNFTFEEE